KCFVMYCYNIEYIITMVNLVQTLAIDVRFIEEMPYNGDNKESSLKGNYHKRYEHIQEHFGSIQKLEDPKSSTSYNYKIPGFKGEFGIIAAYSRSFCGNCNRARVSPLGILKTCLYEGGGINLKDVLRSGKSDDELKQIIIQSIHHKPIDGWEAEKISSDPNAIHQSMATIGG